jgi:hypothetical protein
MSAPLVINLRDGSVWERRAVTGEGVALYALAGSCKCPEFVMATESELAALGIAGSADVLPMPVGPKPQAVSLPLKVVAELNDLRMRLAGMANPPREVYLALYEGAEPELFTTAEAARECCDDLAKSDAGENYWDWTVNESGIHVQFWTHADDDRPLSETSGTVTPIVVQGDDDLSEPERLRARVAELEAERRKYVGAEPTIAEEMAYLSRCLDSVLAFCDEQDKAARLFELPMPEWIVKVREAADGLVERSSYPLALPWAALMDDEDRAEFLDELADAATPNADGGVRLAEVERTCATWRLITEAQHGHNTAPGPDAAESYVSRSLPPRDAVCARPGCGHTGAEHHHGDTRCWAHLAKAHGDPNRLCVCAGFVAAPTVERPVNELTAAYMPVAVLREDPHDSPLYHPYRLGHDLPETGGAR